VVRVAEISGFESVTTAFGTTEPDESVTVPRREVVPDWAYVSEVIPRRRIMNIDTMYLVVVQVMDNSFRAPGQPVPK